MCYSSMIRANYREFVRMFGATISIREFVQLYVERSEGSALRIPKAMDAPFLESPAGGEEQRIAELIRTYDAAQTTRETLINGVREWNREPSCSRFPHRGKEVPIEHVFRRFRVVPGALCALRTECFQGWPATVSWRAPDWRDRTS
ncbi:hypothetical protein RPSD_51940 (plasmid) [Ralstonia solanacearum]|nr:hypothetical protein RPSD_51940 [Ralstonia solanacearum]